MSSLKDFIQANQTELTRMCVVKMGELHQAADVDHFDALIAELIDALTSASARNEASAVAARHGAERQSCGDDIKNLSIEIGLISDSVGELAGRQDRSFRAADYRVFNKWLDTAISAAVERFAIQQHEKEEGEITERLGAVAHELRNALSSAKMAFAQVEAANGTACGVTGQVLGRSLKRLAKLVDQLLLVARTRACTAELAKVDVARILAQVRDAAVTERGVRVDVESAAPVLAWADQQLLTSAVFNLVQNGVKFTHDGGRIVLRACVEDDRVRIDVEDGCGGLPENACDVLFHPFSQSRPDRRGLGLGLSITRQAVEAQAGKIDVRDRPGDGCTFSIWLRRAR